MSRLADAGRQWWFWPASAVAGLALGAASVYPYVYTNGPLHLLGNSAAVWLLAAFGVGVVGGQPGRGALAGAILLVATVASFFTVYNVLFPADRVGRVVAFWLGAAVVGGPLFGLAGGIWRSGGSLRRGVTAAIVGGAFVAEALAFEPVSGEVWRWFEVIGGVALCLVLATNRRARVVALCTLPACVALGVLGWIVTKHVMNVTLV
jgi:hypothetical protein